MKINNKLNKLELLGSKILGSNDFGVIYEDRRQIKHLLLQNGQDIEGIENYNIAKNFILTGEGMVSTLSNVWSRTTGIYVKYKQDNILDQKRSFGVISCVGENHKRSNSIYYDAEMILCRSQMYIILINYRGEIYNITDRIPSKNIIELQMIYNKSKEVYVLGTSRNDRGTGLVLPLFSIDIEFKNISKLYRFKHI